MDANSVANGDVPPPSPPAIVIDTDENNWFIYIIVIMILYPFLQYIFVYYFNSPVVVVDLSVREEDRRAILMAEQDRVRRDAEEAMKKKYVADEARRAEILENIAKEKEREDGRKAAIVRQQRKQDRSLASRNQVGGGGETALPFGGGSSAPTGSGGEESLTGDWEQDFLMDLQNEEYRTALEKGKDSERKAKGSMIGDGGGGAVRRGVTAPSVDWEEKYLMEAQNEEYRLALEEDTRRLFARQSKVAGPDGVADTKPKGVPTERITATASNKSTHVHAPPGIIPDPLEVPIEPPLDATDTVRIMLRCLNGKKVQRRFTACTSLQLCLNWSLAVNELDASEERDNYELSTIFPAEPFTDEMLTKSFTELSMSGAVNLVIRRK